MKMFIYCRWALLWGVLMFANTNAQQDDDGGDDGAQGDDQFPGPAEECDWEAVDTCPFVFDGSCDGGWEPECGPTSDCFDCDPCSLYNIDCGGCVENGCFWCPSDARCVSQPLGEDYWDKYPLVMPACRATEDWKTSCEAIGENNFFSDPYYDANVWAYNLMNLPAVWAMGITGAGVNVRVNDDGVDGTSTEYAFSVEDSCDIYMPANDTESHGTRCASVIAGKGNNGECATGVAPGVTISGCTTNQELTDAELMSTNLGNIHISSNSWGPDPCVRTNERRLQTTTCPFNADHVASPCGACEGFFQEGGNLALSKTLDDCLDAVVAYCSKFYELDPIHCADYFYLFISCEFEPIPPASHEAYVQATTQGRDGKGIIFVRAAGNEYETGMDTNHEPYVSSRFSISVGAVDQKGIKAEYSVLGASLLVTAPAGDDEYLTQWVTAKPFGGCMDAGTGTSFSCPAAAGVVALMLEANPELGWRDVQGIIAETSFKTDPDHDSWSANGDGLLHSYWYGFGIIDAYAAVNASLTWENYGPEQQILAQSGAIELAIEDSESVTTNSSVVVDEDTDNFWIEHVVVYVVLDHNSRGDLLIELTAPSGMSSILHPGKLPENKQLLEGERWKFSTVRHWNEDPNGEWTLSITDVKEGALEDCVDVPFSAVLPGEDYPLDCSLIEEEAPFDCADGAVTNDEVFELFSTEDGSTTAADACCICGGGTIAADSVNALKSWDMIIYGHIREEEDETVTRRTPYGS